MNERPGTLAVPIGSEETTHSYYDRERPSITNLVTDGKNRVFDLGCGMGAVGRKLLESGKATEVLGAELFEDAAREAAKVYRHVHVGNVETIDFPYDQEFDFVICGDVLEHLQNPYSMVAKIYRWLKPGGRIICSLPNIRNWRVLKDLVVSGRWEYEDSGIMDRTHLRFFTRKTSIQMLREAGFSIEINRMLIYGPKKNFCNRVTLGLLEEFLATQVLLRGVKPTAP